MNKLNSTKFLEGFVAIEQYLRETLDIPKGGFVHMVQIASKSIAVIKRYQFELIEFAQLRNAIVHNRGGNNEAIAEPHDSVVKSIERIRQEVEAPKRFKDILALTGIFSSHEAASFAEVLKLQKKFNYSAVPIYKDHQYVGLLHMRLYQRLLEENVDKILDLSVLSVKDVLVHYQEDNRVLFMSKNTTLLEAVQSYNRLHDQGRNMIAIIVTENGSKNEKPLGILTSSDMPKIMASLE